MKKFLPLMLVLVLFCPFVSSANELRADIKGNIKANLEDREQFRSETKAEFKAKIDDHGEKRGQLKDDFKLQILKRVDFEFQMMIKRFNAAIERLGKIGDRIDSRIAKLKSENKDTTDAEKHLSDARAKIEIAKTDIANLVTLSADAKVKIENSSTTPVQTPFKDVRELAQKIRKGLIDAHKDLMDSIRAVRATIGVKTEVESGTN